MTTKTKNVKDVQGANVSQKISLDAIIAQKTVQNLSEKKSNDGIIWCKKYRNSKANTNINYERKKIRQFAFYIVGYCERQNFDSAIKEYKNFAEKAKIWMYIKENWHLAKIENFTNEKEGGENYNLFKKFILCLQYLKQENKI